MKEIGGIISVTIGDQTFNIADFKNEKPRGITLQLDTETSRKFYQQEREKLLNNGAIEFIKLNK